MQQRMLGRTGIEVSVLGLGTVKLGRNRGVKYPRGFDLPDDDAVRRLLDTAADCGINLIDTAPAYGASESRLGALLPGRREDWVLATKAGEDFDGEQSHFDFRPEAIRASAERSRANLRVDVLDVLLIHSDGSDLDLIERAGVLEVLADLKAEGLIRTGGMSTKTAEGARRAIERGADVLMLALSPADRSQLDVIRTALARGVGVLIKKALESGHAAARSDTPDPVRTALDFVYAAAPVSSVVVGTLNPDHLRRNAAAAQAAATAPGT
ncbi:MAG: aldo/keto reductase [Phycisphaerales bacterium]|nr:aldo/keto reductase [Phycisphaerales bacterium]